ncbi:epimerase [Rhodothermaceae bacterium RA]|nr:epimerase [Rhodothermaceae bacterium RA]
MNVILFGATGMIGTGALTECLADPRIDRVLSVGRRPTGVHHDKLDELIRSDFYDYTDVEALLTGYDACLFCLGVSAAGKDEAEYHRLTYDLTLATAQTLARLNPAMTFCYVSGEGADSTEQSRQMWARVKGKTENALLQLPFKAVYIFRPAYIQPVRGARSRTPLYRAFYAVLTPLYPILKRAFPGYVTTTETVGRALIEAAVNGAEKPILHSREINALARRSPRRSAQT